LNHFGVNRREALRRLASGAVAVAAHAAQPAIVAQTWKPRVLTAWQDQAIVALTELIIPETDTPGAKAARVNRFIDSVLYDARPSDRDAFFRGLAWMDARSKAMFGKDLVAASAAEQTALLTRVSHEDNKSAEDRPGIDFFQALKAMTINGYYTTEVGLRKELGDDGQLFSLEFKGCDHPEHLG
jgi:hypothetical protein